MADYSSGRARARGAVRWWKRQVHVVGRRSALEAFCQSVPPAPPRERARASRRAPAPSRPLELPAAATPARAAPAAGALDERTAPLLKLALLKVQDVKHAQQAKLKRYVKACRAPRPAGAPAGPSAAADGAAAREASAERRAAERL
eukprot:tig00001479_g8906.t1